MNRPATKQPQPKTTPTFIAKLDLQDEAQLALHGFIQRMHSGRWPLLKCLGMRQIDGVIYEAVEWVRMQPRGFGVVRWCQDGLGMSWSHAKSASDARAQLRATSGWGNPQRTN